MEWIYNININTSFNPRYETILHYEHRVAKNIKN